LMKDTIRFRVPINPLGRISVKGKKKTIDLKKSALMQIVNGVRIFAIRYGIKEVSTFARLDMLEKLEVFHPRDVKNAKLAMDYLHFFRIQANITQLREEEFLSNMIAPLSLEKEERKQLKESLFIAKRLQQMSELSFAKNRGI
jgi:CBS domain-containing protein